MIHDVFSGRDVSPGMGDFLAFWRANGYFDVESTVLNEDLLFFLHCIAMKTSLIMQLANMHYEPNAEWKTQPL